MSIDPTDFINRHSESDCCGAPIMSGGICSDCHEHCEAVKDDDEPDYDAPKQLTPTENWQKNDEHHQ